MGLIKCPKQYCGKIFITNNYLMMIECKYCNEEFVPYDEFLKHIFDKHFDNIEVYESDNENDYDDETCILSAKGSACLTPVVPRIRTHSRCEKAEQSTEISISKTTHRKRRISAQQHNRQINEIKSRANSTSTTNIHPVRTYMPAIKKHAKLDRKHKCKYCGAEFLTKDTLNHHEIRHSDNKAHGCTECDKRFFTKSELNTHMRWHTGERPFVCIYCGSSFVSSSALGSHEIFHLNERKFKCDQCDKSYLTGRNLKRHRTVHTGERNYKCDICSNTFTRPGSLSNHKKLHENALRYECNICSKRFNQKPALIWHKKRNHDIVTDTDTIANENILLLQTNEIPSSTDNQKTCDYCGLNFIDNELLLNHQHTVHALKGEECEIILDFNSIYKINATKMAAIESPKQYCGEVFVTKDYVMMLECKFCGEEFVQYVKFLKHIFDDHFDNVDAYKSDDEDDDDDFDQGISIFNAHESDDNYTSDHIDISRAEQSTEISTSNTTVNKAKVSLKDPKNQESYQQPNAASTKIRAALKKTRKTKKNVERKFKCKFCDDAFYTAPHLKKHEQRHTDNKPFACTECDKKFFTRNELTTHIRWHTGERPFVCTYCGRGFVSRSALNTHEKRHLNERSYKCDQCSKSYFTSAALKQHMLLHTGIRIYKCNYCTDTFSRSGTLRNHMKLHENALRYECNICQRRFNQRPLLVWHQKNKHDVIMNEDIGGGAELIQQALETESGVKNMYTCEHCDVNFKDKEELENHQHTIHAFEEVVNEITIGFV
ncbi:zinc finger protein 93-like [Eurosta solidaginis]|uniref:zinc finger protein 93-like n=1 Tax=Eurosta solidaginis TaxID=178769 RepID=UPI00353174F1